MPDLLTFVILSAATYRVARFLILDTLIENLRIRVHTWLTNPESISVTRLKVAELITCPWCLTVWVALAVVTFWSLVVVDWIGWAFLLVWPAVSAGSLVFWTYVDNEEE